MRRLRHLQRFAPLSFGFAALVALITAAVARPAVAADAPAPALRRFALIASANDGGAGRPRLRYADSDARSVAEVLESLGGLAPSDLVLVPSANRDALYAAFTRLKNEVSAAGKVRRELFVYYSGHSDEEGLLLGGERISYAELRGLIDGAGADVRIAILDSCASGALIRLKGGVRRPPFLADLSTDARGHAFLTASSADEAAQESERIGAAFFTHYLLSGLRGAADTTRDGRVTLNEAYQFAYQETLRRTERTVAGPQHPAYDIQLAGTGDLVMTDLRATGAALVLDQNVAGRIYVRDASGRLLVELRKEPLYPVELGLAPGSYQVSLDADGRPFEAHVTLADGTRSHLATGQFMPVASTFAVARGGGADFSAEPTISATGAPVSGYHDIPFEAVLVPGIRTGSYDGRPVRNHFVLGILSQSDALAGVQLSLGGNIVDREMRGLQLGLGNYSRGPTRGAQIGSGPNIVLGPMHGTQLSSLVNVALGEYTGAQIANVNWAHADLRGAQLGVFNRTRGTATGAQIGVAQLAGGIRGAQVGVAGVTTGAVRGVQLNVANVANEVTGLQLGVANAANDANGFQFGVANIARKVRGIQFGVVNVAESSDVASIGLLNLIGDGYHALSFWTNPDGIGNVGLKLGSKHIYTMAGTNLSSDRFKHLDGHEFMLAFGAHVTPVERLFVDLDGLWTHGMSGGGDSWDFMNGRQSARITFGYQIFSHFAITAGPTYTIHRGDGSEKTSRFLDYFQVGLQI